jgi:hypothetical protein
MKKRIVFLMCIIALVSSCSKDEGLIKKDNEKIVENSLTTEQKALKENLQSTALFITGIASIPGKCRVLSPAILQQDFSKNNS